MLRNRGADQVGGICAAGLSLLFSQLYAENEFFVWLLSLSQGMAIPAVSGTAP